MSRLANNALINVGGFFVEFLGMLLILPYVIGKIGLSSFGMVTAIIAMSLMGQMLAQAATAAIVRQISRLRSVSSSTPGLRQELPQISFAIVVLAVLGIGSAICIHIFGESMLAWLQVPPELLGEARLSLGFLKYVLPLILLSNLFASILRGRELFAAANVLKISMVALRLILVVAVFEFFQVGVFPFVVIRTSSIVLEGLAALAFILIIDRNTAINSEPAKSGEPSEVSMPQQYVLVFVLMFYAMGNLIVLELTKIGVGKIFGLAMLGVMGAAATASAFVSRLAQAGALVLNPAVSSLDVNNQSRNADFLAYRSTLLGVVFVGSVTVASLCGWDLLVRVWLGEDINAHWLIMALLFAGQGTVSGIAPLVQSSYGRGRVIGISLIHVISSALGISIAFGLGKSGQLGFMGFVGIVTAVRIVGVLVNIVFAGTRIFGHVPVGRWYSLCLLVVWAWVCGLAGVWVGKHFDLNGVVGFAVAAIVAVVFNFVAYYFIVPIEEREFVYFRIFQRRKR